MIWQDYILTACIYGFVISTIPLVNQIFRKKGYVTPWTALPTSGINFVLAWLWISFEPQLWVSFGSSISVGILWLLITYGSWRNMNESKTD